MENIIWILQHILRTIKKRFPLCSRERETELFTKKEGQTRKEVPGTVAPSLLNESPFAISITQDSDLSTTSAKKVSENNGSKRSALPKAEGDDMLARAYERGAGVKSQTGENSEANASERAFCFPIDVIKTESPSSPTAIGGTPAAERESGLPTDSIHRKEPIVNTSIENILSEEDQNLLFDEEFYSIYKKEQR